MAREKKNLPETEAKGKMTVEEAGRKGGETVAKEYGPEFYSEIGKKGGETTAEKYGPEFYHEIGEKGGKIGGATVSREVAAGKEALGLKGEGAKDTGRSATNK